METTKIPESASYSTNGLTNEDVLKIIDNGSTFRDGFLHLQNEFPSENWTEIPMRVYRTKTYRMKLRLRQLRKNKKHHEIKNILSEEFEFPLPKNDTPVLEDDIQNSKLQILVEKTKNVVTENRNLKRQLDVQGATVEDLDLQIQHSERKVHLLLQLLKITMQKHHDTIKNKSMDVKDLQKECDMWDRKYEQISTQLDNTTEHVENLKIKLDGLNIRNMNKKMKRRDEKIASQNVTISENEQKLREKERVIENLNRESNVKDGAVQDLKKVKRNLLVKVCRLRKGLDGKNFEQKNDEEIGKLKRDIKEKEDKIAELEEINAVLKDEEIRSFYDGKYCNEIRETIMTLITQCGVSLKKVNTVIQTVVSNLTGKSLSRMPSTGVLSRLILEAKRVAQVQVAQAMLNSKPSGGADTYYGNCLHQDGTSKFHRHFQSLQVTTADSRTYSLGLTEVGSGDAETLMAEFKGQIAHLASAVNGDDQTVAELVGSIVSTMSDQGSTNPVFNKQLQEIKLNLLPTVIENWEDMSDAKKAEVSKISSYFCKMHIFVSMAGEVDRCLSVFENTIAEGKNPFAFEWQESGGARVTRTISKALTMHGCEKSGVGSHFSTFLQEKGKKNRLITFRGHRFNHLFCVAGTCYHHLEDIKEFLNSWSGPNDLLKSVNFDIRESAYISSIRALGIIDKIITGPFWKLIESVPNVLALNPYLETLREKLEVFSNDSSSLLAGEEIFPEVAINKDEVYDSLFAEVSDVVMDTYTQMALELATGGMLLILERQAKDQLPGGKFHEPSVNDQMRAAAVPATNTCSERDFAQLDVLMRLKPSASTECYESVIMWSNNKTSEWLRGLEPDEHDKVLSDARKAAPEIKDKVKQKQVDLYNKKLQLLRTRQEKKAVQENKQYTMKVKLTTKLSDVGGLWLTIDDMERYKASVEGKKDGYKDALIIQLQFRKQVINSKGPKGKFQQQVKGHIYTVAELENNLTHVINLNKDQEEEEVGNNLVYKPIDEISDNMETAKCKFAKKLEENRHKIKVSQQQTLLPELIQTPSLLVGKNIKHKFRLPDTREIEWFMGTVQSVHKESGRKSKYCVKYEGEDEEGCFPLLIDIENGDIIIIE